MLNEFQYDVFLSRNSNDKTAVRPLAERLRQDGPNVWPVPPNPPRVGGFDECVLKPGHIIPAKTEEGLERSRVLACPVEASKADALHVGECAWLGLGAIGDDLQRSAKSRTMPSVL
jgi:hypothetical protein